MSRSTPCDVCPLRAREGFKPLGGAELDFIETLRSRELPHGVEALTPLRLCVFPLNQ